MIYRDDDDRSRWLALLGTVCERFNREAMARAFQTGVYTMREIADFFGVHYSTVSRAVRRLGARPGSGAKVRTEG